MEDLEGDLGGQNCENKEKIQPRYFKRANLVANPNYKTKLRYI